MASQLKNFNYIFSDRLFRIPDYQRGYAWGAKQLIDFWEDLVNLPPDRSHYTGMLSIKAVPKKIWKNWTDEKWFIDNQDITPYYVVDGQQRLTTFVIFVQCFVEYVRSLPENAGKTDYDIVVRGNRLESITEKYIATTQPGAIIRAYKFGYDSDNPSFHFMKHNIFGEKNGGNIDESFYTLNLKNAKSFFSANIAAYSKTYGKDKTEELFQTASQSMKLMIHEIDDDFDVFAAFETMNNRGKRLSNLEMLKSRLIYLSTLFTKDQIIEEEREKLRKEIDDAWKEVYYQLGRNQKKPLSDDEFLKAHWLIFYPFINKRGENYVSFLLNKQFVTQNIFDRSIIQISEMSGVDDTEDTDAPGTEDDTDQSEEDAKTIEIKASLKYTDISEYVGSLKETAKYWYITNFPFEGKSLTEDEKKWLDRLNRIGIAYFRPLVVASFLAPDGTAEQRVALFKEIERFIFIAFRMNGAYSTYNQSQVNVMIHKVAVGSITMSEAAESIRERIEDWVTAATDFEYSTFKGRIQRLYSDGGGFYFWGALRYFLYEYESSLVEQNGNAQKSLEYFVKSAKDKVSIEHIYPQTPKNDYWKKQFGNYTPKQRALLTASLGNLLPLSMSVNASLQNDSFPEKKENKVDKDGTLLRRGYGYGSHSEAEVAKDYKVWNGKTILQRGIHLLDFMEKRWDIHFASEADKIDLLFVGFVTGKGRKKN